MLTASVPTFRWSVLALMVAGGIGGGVVGRMLNRRIDEKAVERLFIGLMAVIILISLFNAWRYWA